MTLGSAGLDFAPLGIHNDVTHIHSDVLPTAQLGRYPSSVLTSEMTHSPLTLVLVCYMIPVDSLTRYSTYSSVTLPRAKTSPIAGETKN